MGQKCSALNDVPLPNPKDPTVNKCTQYAITQDDINNETNLGQALIEAEHYCNDEGANPDLINGFNSLAGQAQQDPAKYGRQYYNTIIKFDDARLISSGGLYNTANYDLLSVLGIQELKIQNLFGVVIVTVLPKVVIKKLFGSLADTAGNLLTKGLRTLLRKVLSPQNTEKLLDFLGELAESPVKALTHGILKRIFGKSFQQAGDYFGKLKAKLKSTDPAEMKQVPDEYTNPEFNPSDEAEEALDLPAEATGEEAAEAAGEAVADSVPGLGEIFMAAQLLQLVVTETIDAVGKSTIKYETAYCNNIGDVYEGDAPKDTEWTVYGYGTSCHFNDRHRGYAVDTKAGCCGTACSVYGKGLKCVRQNFRADPFVCCFLDNSCNTSNEDTCFQTPERQRTCHPLFRDLSTQTCRDIIYEYCAGEKLLPGQSDWLEMWLVNSSVDINSVMAVSNLTVVSGHYNPSSSVNERGLKFPIEQRQPCLRAIARAVSTGKICTWEDLKKISVVEGNINTAGFEWSKNLLEAVVKKYTGGGGSFLGGINTDGVNRNGAFYNTLWEICNQLPSLCTNILTENCANYTAQEVATSPFLIPWCSCYLPNAQYEKYEEFGLGKQCSPLCNQTGVIPAVESTGRPLNCLSSVCIIDDTTIDLVNTKFSGSGSVNLNQVCGSCGNSNVTETYSAGNISTNNSSTVNAFIVTPANSNRRGYTELLSPETTFPATPAQRESVMFLVEDSGNVLTTGFDPAQIENYPQCILNIGTDLNKNVGIVSVIITRTSGTNPDTNPLQSGKTYYIGYSTVDGSQLFDSGSIPKVTVKKSNFSGSTQTSQTTNVYAQQGYNVSLNQCQCISSGFSLKTAESRISGKINFTQQCGQSTCYQNQNGQRVPVPCSSTTSSISASQTIENLQNQTIQDKVKNKFFNMFFSIFGLFLISFIFLLLFFFTKSTFRFLNDLLNMYTVPKKTPK